MMSQAAATTGMDNFRALLRNAFINCALDGRRLPFLSQHFSELETFKSEEDNAEVNEGEDRPETTPSTQLMLFLELISFVDLYGATPKNRRRDIAKRIAFKFFLPIKVGTRVEYPIFDFHDIVSRDELRALDDALRSDSAIGAKIFLPFLNAVLESLCGAPFLSFLMSNECARMRGFLRNTAPYRTVLPGVIFRGVVLSQVDGGAHNHFLYNLMYLLCQREKEVCGENDELLGESSPRVLGAAGGVCCAVYIMREIQLMFDDVHSALEDLDDDEQLSPDSEAVRLMIKTLEQLWEFFVAPGVGALEFLSNSSETDDALEVVRKRLKEAQSMDLASVGPFVVSNTVMFDMKNLARELIYDYSVNAYPKFREHPFHEWMCVEVNKMVDDDEDVLHIPMLAPGCIARLVRRADLHSGVSAHRPSRGASRSGATDAKAVYPNAHHAIVFGSDDGCDHVERPDIPGLNRYDIRRYASQSVVLQGDTPTCRVPPTIESYAIAQPFAATPFSRKPDNSRIR